MQKVAKELTDMLAKGMRMLSHTGAPVGLISQTVCVAAQAPARGAQCSTLYLLTSICGISLASLVCLYLCSLSAKNHC